MKTISTTARHNVGPCLWRVATNQLRLRVDWCLAAALHCVARQPHRLWDGEKGGMVARDWRFLASSGRVGARTPHVCMVL